MLHGLAESDSEGGRYRGLLQSVEGLGDDEDVVNTNTKQDEGDDCVSC